jgi:putative DNA primase/helicase
LARGTGFLTRFLVSWPDSTQGFQPFTDPPSAWPALAKFHQRIAAILNTPAPIGEDGTLSPSMLTLTPDAKNTWVAFHDAVEKELRTGGELYDVRDVASKSADNATRLAGLFQAFEQDVGGAVSRERFEGASRIVAWHLNESRRFFGELAMPEELVNIVRLDSWLLNYCRCERTHSVPVARVQQYGPSETRRKQQMEEALRELEELARSRLVCEGRRKEIRVNPVLLRDDVP